MEGTTASDITDAEVQATMAVLRKNTIDHEIVKVSCIFGSALLSIICCAWFAELLHISHFYLVTTLVVVTKVEKKMMCCQGSFT